MSDGKGKKRRSGNARKITREEMQAIRAEADARTDSLSAVERINRRMEAIADQARKTLGEGVTIEVVPESEINGGPQRDGQQTPQTPVSNRGRDDR